MRLIAALVLSAALTGGPTKLTTVSIKNMQFSPHVISVARGATVVWKNNDQVPHTVTAVDGSFASPLIQPGSTFRKKFTKAGKVDIVCTPHPTMTQTVTVR